MSWKQAKAQIVALLRQYPEERLEFRKWFIHITIIARVVADQIEQYAP